MKKLLTTGEIAKLLGVSGNQVIRWIDRQLLPAFRVPGSTHRRVLVTDLVRFVEEQGLPVELIAELTEQVQS